jgi:toxin FitB
VSARGFVLDTNVVSELIRPQPDAKLLHWISRRHASELFLAAVSLGEIVRGVTRLPDGPRRSRLEPWVSELLPRQFAGRILAFDQPAAVIWGELMGTADRAGRPRAAADAQIAATALRHEMTLVTRNTADFEGMIPALLNPWQ